MTTTHERVRAVREALVELRRGDLEAIIDIERYAQQLPEPLRRLGRLQTTPITFAARMMTTLLDTTPNSSATSSRRRTRGTSGHVPGRLWEFHFSATSWRLARPSASHRDPVTLNAVLLTETPSSPPFSEDRGTTRRARRRAAHPRRGRRGIAVDGVANLLT